MKKYEYIRDFTFDSDLVATLKERGNDGWELIHLEPYSQAQKMVWKREIKTSFFEKLYELFKQPKEK